MKEIKVEHIKKALRDSSFRALFPDFRDDMDQFLRNPDCKCNAPLYNAIMRDTANLKKYFGNDVVVTDPPLPEQDEDDIEQINQWNVINCHIDQLEQILDQFRAGPVQLAIARYEDQITVVINNPVFQ